MNQNILSGAIPNFLKENLKAKSSELGLTTDCLVLKLLIESLGIDPFAEMIKDRDFRYLFLNEPENYEAFCKRWEEGSKPNQPRRDEVYHRLIEEMPPILWAALDENRRLEWIQQMATWHGSCGYGDISVCDLLQTYEHEGGLQGLSIKFGLSMHIVYRSLSSLVKKWLKEFPNIPRSRQGE